MARVIVNGVSVETHSYSDGTFTLVYPSKEAWLATSDDSVACEMWPGTVIIWDEEGNPVPEGWEIRGRLVGMRG